MRFGLLMMSPTSVGAGPIPSREPGKARVCDMSIKSIAVALLFVIVLLGAAGGDKAVQVIGDAIGKAGHWVSVAWDSATGNNP
jgi:hypothetical protein